MASSWQIWDYDSNVTIQNQVSTHFCISAFDMRESIVYLTFTMYYGKEVSGWKLICPEPFMPWGAQGPQAMCDRLDSSLHIKLLVMSKEDMTALCARIPLLKIHKSRPQMATFCSFFFLELLCFSLFGHLINPLHTCPSWW